MRWAASAVDHLRRPVISTCLEISRDHSFSLKAEQWPRSLLVLKKQVPFMCSQKGHSIERERSRQGEWVVHGSLVSQGLQSVNSCHTLSPLLPGLSPRRMASACWRSQGCCAQAGQSEGRRHRLLQTWARGSRPHPGPRTTYPSPGGPTAPRRPGWRTGSGIPLVFPVSQSLTSSQGAYRVHLLCAWHILLTSYLKGILHKDRNTGVQIWLFEEREKQGLCT